LPRGPRLCGRLRQQIKESAVMEALLQAQWVVFALPPVLLGFVHLMGKRW
jgi:hypothetical protein